MLTRRFLFCLLTALLLVGQAAAQDVDDLPRNVIVFISDGAGPASFTLARDYLRYQQGRDQLALDAMLVGSIHTYSTDSRVTDSAAGATAFACGVKTYNGAIAVDTLKRPVATLLEAAEARGMATGLVATSRITHATPASFSAHVEDRWMENEIAAQQLYQGIDVIFGGGRRHFVPEPNGGRRTDGRNLIDEARADGYHIVLDRAAFVQERRTPVLGLFTMDHMAYEIDRDTLQEPSLAEMTTKALDMLQDDPDGFFLMVEGSRIDHAGHDNDAAAHLHDLLAFDEAIAVARAFAEQDGETLVVSTSDHETGGLSLGRSIDGDGIYAWEPAVLAGVPRSQGAMIDAVFDQDMPPDEVLRTYAGIDDLSDAELVALEQARTDPMHLNFAMAEAIARRAILGWTTGGHTAVDVNLYAVGPGSDRFAGHHDNTYVGKTLAELLGFDLASLTKQLTEKEAVGSE